MKVSHHAFYESFKLGPCSLVNGMTWAGEWSAYIDGQCRAKLSALPSSVGGQGRDSDWACMGRGGHDVLPIARVRSDKTVPTNANHVAYHGHHRIRP